MYLGAESWTVQTARKTINSLNPLGYLSRCENLQKITLYKFQVADGDYSILGNFHNLSELRISLCNLRDVSWVGSLENLNICYLSRNEISSGIRAFENLVRLETLNLENNISLQEIMSDEKGVYSCCEVLARLANNGVLKNLYLEGCSGLANKSVLAKIVTWKEKSGF